MVKNHLSRIAAPRTWHVERKIEKWIAKPNPGGHSLNYGLSISVLMRDILKIAKNVSEVKKIMHTKDVLVDKQRRKDNNFCVGLMDVIEFLQIEKQFRVLLDKKGRLVVIPIDETENNTKLSRIEGKTKIKGGKIQLNLFDGRNLIVDKDSYSVGDTLQIALPKQDIQKHFKLENGASVMLIGGKHSGTVAKVEDIIENKLLFKVGTKKFETAKKYAFVIGDDKPALKCFDALIKLQK